MAEKSNIITLVSIILNGGLILEIVRAWINRKKRASDNLKGELDAAKDWQEYADKLADENRKLLSEVFELQKVVGELGLLSERLIKQNDDLQRNTGID